jgi:hypothetical protein
VDLEEAGKYFRTGVALVLEREQISFRLLQERQRLVSFSER